jgi:hypothetical protein
MVIRESELSIDEVLLLSKLLLGETFKQSQFVVIKK